MLQQTNKRDHGAALAKAQNAIKWALYKLRNNALEHVLVMEQCFLETHLCLKDFFDFRHRLIKSFHKIGHML